MDKLRYGKCAEALYELALAENKVAEYQTALKEVAVTFQANPDFQNLLSSYALAKEKAFALIDEVYASSPLKSFRSFLKVLVDRHAIDHFHEVEAAYDSLANAYQGVKEGIVYSVDPLSEEAKGNLEKCFSAKLGTRVVLENHLDRGLIGGVKVALDGKVYDGSLEARVEALRHRLLTNGGNL